jgi:uncharacterized membrane protein
MAEMHEWYKDEHTGQYVHDVSVTVMAPVEKCYTQWEDLEKLPRIMTHLTEVRCTGDGMSHWEADVTGRHVEWEAKTTALRTNEEIAWHSTSGLRNSGVVRFLPEKGGCRIVVHLMYDPPYGRIGDYVAEHRANDVFHEQLRRDLQNFKHAIEAGETPGERHAA